MFEPLEPVQGHFLPLSRFKGHAKGVRGCARQALRGKVAGWMARTKECSLECAISMPIAERGWVSGPSKATVLLYRPFLYSFCILVSSDSV